VPGSSLVGSLADALERSAAGIIIWSRENRDSKWVIDEYETMVALKNAPKSDFRFVVAKLDAAEVPVLERKALYQDFSDSPEGPRGSPLLRLMFGLVGTPPSPEAVRFAEWVDQETKDTLAKIQGAKLVGDVTRLIELGRGSGPSWRASPLLASRAAQALIDLGQNEAAIDILTRAEAEFPRCIRPKQLRALAVARQGDWRVAQQILSEVYVGGHRDAETLGLFARTWMDR